MKTEQELMKQNVLHSRLAFVGGVLAAPVMAFFAPILVAMEIENNNLRLIGYSPSAREVNAEYRKRLAIFFKEYVIKLPSHTYNRVFNNGMAKIQDLHKKNELEITKNFHDTVNSIMESDFADMYVKLLSAKKIDLQYFEKPNINRQHWKNVFLMNIILLSVELAPNGVVVFMATRMYPKMIIMADTNILPH